MTGWLFIAVLLAFMPAWAEENHGTVELSGVIMGVDQALVAGAEVSLFRTKNVKKPADYSSSKTGEDGRYRVVVPPGNYYGIAVFRKSGKKFGPLAEGDRHSGEPILLELQENLEQDFEVMDLREAAWKNQKRNEDVFAVSGQIVDESGQPQQGFYALASVASRFKKFPRGLSAWTDVDGRYLLFLPAGHYFVGATKVYPPDQELILSKEVDLRKDFEGLDIVVRDD